MLAACLDPRGQELWLENCGVASYTLPPLPPAMRRVPASTACTAPPRTSTVTGSAAP
jgi:hypothetical protein